MFDVQILLYFTLIENALPVTLMKLNEILTKAKVGYWHKPAYCLSLIFPKFWSWTFIFLSCTVGKKWMFESVPRLCPSVNGGVITTKLSGPVCSVTAGQTLQSILHCPLHSLQTSPWVDLLLRRFSLNRSTQGKDCRGSAKKCALFHLFIL